jgi:alpha-D-xyloside xylohydrolase
MISIWPNMRGESPNQVELREQGCLLGNDSTYNAFAPKARALYWQQAYDGLFKYGLDAWWCDCTEPFEADWRGKIKPEPWKRAVVNTDTMKTYLDPAYINAYSLLHSQAMYEGQRSVTEE